MTGELDKAAQAYQEAIESYPREYKIRSEGAIDLLRGQYEKAEAALSQSRGDDVGPDVDLANTLLALQRFDEARQIIEQAQARKLDSFVLHNAIYGLGFLQADSSVMAAQQQWFTGKPEENIGISLASDTEAYAGHLRAAQADFGSRLRQAVPGAQVERDFHVVFNGLAVKSQRWMLTAANIDAAGPRGIVRAQGLALLFAGVLRTFVFNHSVHHRGQLSVYLRLCDVAVPPMFGPTADAPF